MYPDRLIRGISDEDRIKDQGGPSASVFYFKEVLDKKPSKREDGCFEESINWYDEEEALSILLNQKKENGECKYKAGAAILSREEIDRIRIRPRVRGKLSYERNLIADNKYHGNLLLYPEITKAEMMMIATSLAFICFDYRIPQENP